MLTTKEEKVPEKSGVGVIVARLQVPELTQGHRELIESVMERHHQTVILLGLNGAGTSTRNNPLDFQSRKQMVAQAYPQVQIAYIKDDHCDRQWSRNLDEIIGNHSTVGSSVTLYGSRDSFAKYYSGKHEVKILEPETDISGTQARERVRELSDKRDPKFRQGAIWANQHNYPVTYPTVDVAIIDYENNRILLGRKPKETKWRFPGGFVDPQNGFVEDALEKTVVREVAEETSVEVADIQYIGSYFVDDWRYRNEVDSIMTTLFTAKYIFGSAKGGDDIDEVKWFPLDKSTIDEFGPESHAKMFNILLNKIQAGTK